MVEHIGLLDGLSTFEVNLIVNGHCHCLDIATPPITSSFPHFLLWTSQIVQWSKCYVPSELFHGHKVCCLFM
jgi:hypothetical protein